MSTEDRQLNLYPREQCIMTHSMIHSALFPNLVIHVQVLIGPIEKNRSSTLTLMDVQILVGCWKREKQRIEEE